MPLLPSVAGVYDPPVRERLAKKGVLLLQHEICQRSGARLMIKCPRLPGVTTDVLGPLLPMLPADPQHSPEMDGRSAK